MLKFLFGGKKTTPEAIIESDRARFERLVSELNEVIDTLATKPRVTVNPSTGHVLLETPEQFADEALSLPSPEASDIPSGPGEADAPDKTDAADTAAKEDAAAAEPDESADKPNAPTQTPAAKPAPTTAP